MPLPPRPTGQRGDSWGSFLLQNINDFPFLPGLGIDISWHCPRKLPAVSPPACPPISPRTTWEEATPQAGSGFMALPAWLPEQAGEPHLALSPCCRQRETPSTGCDAQEVTKVTLGENLSHTAPVTSSPNSDHAGELERRKGNERDRNNPLLQSRDPL